MTQIVRLISKYSIILSLSILTGKLWFYFSNHIIPIDSPKDISFLHKLPAYFSYFFNLLTSILLLVDMIRLKLKNYIIPLVGLFYPIIGITGLLIIIIYRDNDKASA